MVHRSLPSSRALCARASGPARTAAWVGLLALLGCAGGGGAGPGSSGAPADMGVGLVADAGGPGGVDAPVSVPDPGPPAVVNPEREALIAELIGRIKQDEVRALTQTLQDLSQPNRASGTENYKRVTEWARQLVTEESPALQVRFDERGELRNVEITLKGSDPAAGVYIVGGHLDSVRRTPGMDDNGSGSLGTALVARALGHYRFKSEIRFLLFDAEENGLVGSTFYAKALLAAGCAPKSCLKFYLNMDMIGHDPDNRRRVQLFTAVPSIVDLLTQTEKTHQIGLTVNRSSSDACNSSDDCAFSRQGYDTSYVFEAKYFPMRHTPSDTVDVINFDSMTKILKLVAASLATVASIEGQR
jgi:leucyl aminopeptidase